MLDTALPAALKEDHHMSDRKSKVHIVPQIQELLQVHLLMPPVVETCEMMMRELSQFLLLHWDVSPLMIEVDFLLVL